MRDRSTTAVHARSSIAGVFLVLLAATVPCVPAQEKTAEETDIRFLSYDLLIDSGKTPLAAYQVEIGYPSGTVKIVGIEGGAPAAYTNAPFFDRGGFEGGRIVLAAFTTDDAASPTGLCRVARIHLAVEKVRDADLSVRLVTSARPGGKRFVSTVKLVPTPRDTQSSATKSEGTGTVPSSNNKERKP